MPTMTTTTIAKTLTAAAAAGVVAAFAFAAIADDDNTDNTLRIAATTSVHNAGLLDALVPVFEEECQCRVHVVVAGSGKALKLGEHGDVDMLLVHAPESERQYVKDGHGIGRRTIMHNAFVLAGPPNDPAAAEDAETIAEAMKIIATKHSPFVSRGDDSGTHKKEMHLWQQNQAANINDKWRVQAGAGMGRALLMADHLRAYILTDSATFAALREKTNLRIIKDDTPPLRNDYSIIIVNPARHPQTNEQLARRFGEWLLSPAAQTIIAGYEKFGARLFSPAAELKDEVETTTEPTSALMQALHLLFSGDAALWRIIFVSLFVSVAALLAATPAALAAAYMLANRQFKGRRFILALLQSLLSFPTVAVGLILYLLLSRRGVLGAFDLLFTPAAMAAGQALIVFPVLTVFALAALQKNDNRIGETAQTLGASKLRAAITEMAEARFGIVAALLTGFGRAISEVGCALMVGGNIANYTRNITTAIALETGAGKFAEGIALGMVLVFLALVASALLSRVQGGRQ